MGAHATQQSHASRHTVRRLLASLAILGAVCGGFLAGSAVAAEPAKCNTSVDKVCYAGYNAAGLKQIADDLSEKGKGSTYYAAMEKNLTDGVKGTLTLSDGSNLPFRLIGILHDDRADGSGRKAGLTFMAWNALPKAYCMNGTPSSDSTNECVDDGHTNKGGWRDSDLRKWMNDGEIWNQFPEDFRNNVITVLKQTNNMDEGGTLGSSASATADKVWLVSYRELVPAMYYDSWEDNEDCFRARSQEGTQYEFFRTANGLVSNNHAGNSKIANIYKTVSGSIPIGAYSSWSRGYWWERSLPDTYSGFFVVDSYGNPYEDHHADFRQSVVPAFSF